MKPKLNSWILLLICGAILWLGLVQKQASGLVEDTQILHLLNRLSFGPTYKQIEQVRSKGVETYLQEQLAPDSIPEFSQLELHLAQLETLKMSPTELFQKYVPNPQMKEKKGRELSAEEKDKLLQQRWRVMHQAVEGRLARAIASKRQLQEVMIDFWFNHFNVYGKKAIASIWVGDYENDIRIHALGRFRDLLEVTARHPAMLLYLDNEVNTDPHSPGARGRFKGLNENYARELMELHTLGVDGGYTQADVTALARIFTGWGIDRSGSSKREEKGFFFDENRHDFSDKVFLGTTIKGSGIEEGEKALDILVTHPSTAHFISYKLAQYFVADEPPQSLVDKLAQKFRKTDGDIRAILDTLFHSTEFNDPQYYGKKFKTPYQYLISIVRAARIDNPDYQQLREMLEQLGMPVYGCLTPDGYASTKDVWLNPDGMLRRISLATEIAIGALNKNQVNAEVVSATLNDLLSPHTKQVLHNSPPRLRTALMLGSPEMMYK
ncbi:DUF1800 domain-containing protein [Pleurocapsales cyanobacterium LEGE 06147]|nr:DUF1800 domain-containing protein [Pleurocapsales cyanobacterium LEGE 06147]